MKLNISVVNKRNYRGTCDSQGHYIGRPSKLGNPYSSKSYGLGQKVEGVQASIDLYEIWLRKQIDEGNQPVIDELNLIYDKSLEKRVDLICWCHPAPCHGNVIIEIITEYASKKET